MKILFALSLSIILTILHGALTSPPDTPTPYKNHELAEATLRAMIAHEEYTVWDKKFDRYSNFWLQHFEKVQAAQNAQPQK